MRKLLGRDCICACVSVYTIVSNVSTETSHGHLSRNTTFPSVQCTVHGPSLRHAKSSEKAHVSPEAKFVAPDWGI
jgi:hypothetical protein